MGYPLWLGFGLLGGIIDTLPDPELDSGWTDRVGLIGSGW
jgi:hypothetical protein